MRDKNKIIIQIILKEIFFFIVGLAISKQILMSFWLNIPDNLLSHEQYKYLDGIRNWLIIPGAVLFWMLCTCIRLILVKQRKDFNVLLKKEEELNKHN